MDWLEVNVITDGEGAEAVSELLRPFAYNEGVVLEQLGDENDPDPNALESTITVKIYIPEDEDRPARRRQIEEALYHLGRLYPMPPPTFRKLKEEDWANAWKAHYQPFRIGERIWIQPSWLASRDERQQEGLRPRDVVLVLDPGMAFGTGLHPTTQMCLQVLEQLVQPGMTLLDVGTGSGILAIAGVKLGIISSLAIDRDEIAVKTAAANAIQNGVATQITIRQGTLSAVPKKKWDIVVVNILAPVIIELLRADNLLDYLAESGFLILSGIIDSQAATIKRAVVEVGGRIEQTFVVRDWISFVAQV